MPSVIETEMGRNVQRSRRALKNLLTRAEWITKSARGSEYPTTFEDTAREISESDDPRAQEVGLVLTMFQADVNRLWEHAVAAKMPLRHVRAWVQREKPPLETTPLTYEDAVSEATMLMRAAIIRFNPAKGNIWSYSRLGVFRGLRLWFDQQRAPVEVPEKVAKDPTKEIIRESLAEHPEYHEEPYHDDEYRSTH